MASIINPGPVTKILSDFPAAMQAFTQKGASMTQLDTMGIITIGLAFMVIMANLVMALEVMRINSTYRQGE